MRSFIIATDTTADLPKDYIEKNDLGLFSLSYTIVGETYSASRELPEKEFYSLNTLLAVAGTTGYCGGDSELSMMIDVLRFLADTLGKQAKAAERNWQPPNNTRRKDFDQK